MSIGIKICGLSTAYTAQVAANAGAAFLGFVFHPKSPRFVTPEQARAILDVLDSEAHPKAVALTCDVPDDELATLIGKMRPDLIQLHGQETPERTAHVRQEFGLPVIKAVSIASADDLKAAKAFESTADYLLLDAKAPKDAAYPGGHGTAFDWSLLKGWHSDTPWFLAGGLTPASVTDAIAATGARLVDVSSGVEETRGVKSVDAIAAFVKSATADGSQARSA